MEKISAFVIKEVDNIHKNGKSIEIAQTLLPDSIVLVPDEATRNRLGTPDIMNSIFGKIDDKKIGFKFYFYCLNYNLEKHIIILL